MKRHTNNDHLRKIHVDAVLRHRANFIQSDGKVFLLRCPSCERENWSERIATGKCAWCQWSAYRE